jgi:N-acyl-L-homoserine lactone synthetase
MAAVEAVGVDRAALRTADAVAKRVLELAAPVRIVASGRPSELEAILRLRFEVASEMGWIGPDEALDGLERDAYDNGAVHVGAWDGERLVGTQRIVFPTPGGRTPLEEAFGLQVEPRSQVVHADRTAVVRDHRGDDRHLLLAALMARSWLICRSRGFHRCTGVVSDPILHIYREIGLEVAILGEAREYCGEFRFPTRFDVPAAAARLSAVWMT